MSPLYALLHRVLTALGAPRQAPRYAGGCNIHWANFR